MVIGDHPQDLGSHVGSDVFGERTPLEDGHALSAQSAQLAEIGFGRPGEANLEGPGLAGTDAVFPHPHHRFGGVLGDPRFELCDDRIHVIESGGVHDDLSVRRVGGLRIHGQVEARRPLSHEGGHVSYVLALEEVLLHLPQCGGDILDPRPLGHPVVDHQLVAARLRKEHLRHATEAEQRGHQQHAHRREKDEAVPDRRSQEPAKTLVEPPAVGIRIAALRRSGQHVHALERRHGDGEKPRENERDAGHREECPAVFPGVGRRGEDRVEGHHRDEGGAEERPSRARGTLQGGLPTVHTALEPNRKAVGHHDCVVDHHAERDHQSAERHALQVDAEDGHHHEGAQDRQQQSAPDDHAHSPAERNGQHGEDDRHGLAQVDQEAVHRRAHLVRLPGDPVHLDAVRQLCDQLRQAPIDGPTGLDDVPAGDVGQRQGLGVPTVETHLPAGRLQNPAADRGDVADAEQLAATPISPAGALEGLQRCRGDDQLADLLGRAKSAGRGDAKTPVLQIDGARVHHHVLLAKGRGDLVVSETQRGEPRLGYLHHHDPLRRPPLLHPRHSGHYRKLPAQVLDVLVELLGAEPVGGDRQQEAVDDAEVVGDHRGAGAGRKQPLRVGDLVAELVPDLGQAVGPVLALNVDADAREPGTGGRVQVLELGKLLDRLLQDVGDLELDLFRARAGVGGHHDRGLDGELGVLELAQGREAAQPAQHQHQDGEVADRTVLDSKGSKLHVPALLCLSREDAPSSPRAASGRRRRRCALFP